MSDRSPARSILGGAAVVVLSGAAAYFGASLAQHAPAPLAPPPEKSSDAALEPVLRRLDDMDRRLDLVEETARTALELARAHGGAAAPAAAPAKAEPAGPPAGAGTGDSEPPAPPVAEPDRNDGADGQMARLREISHVTTQGRVVHAMALFTDATREGAANRLAQSIADAQSVVTRFALKGDDTVDKVRQVFLDEWERGARDIGPIVHDGLEKADIATVRTRLREIHAETDRRLRPFFDDTTWKDYETAAAGARLAGETILDEYEKARLGTNTPK